MPESPFRVNCSGLKKGSPPDSCAVIIFGASGDLARRELIPSLYALYCEGLLPEPFAVIGAARTAWSDDAFRTKIYDAMKNDAAFHPERWRQFSQLLFYQQIDYDSHESQVALYEKVREVSHAQDPSAENVLFHLSVPPAVYPVIIDRLGAGPLARSEGGWRRVIIEKPFGRDEATARALDQQLRRFFREEQLYRIDHFLGKETVQNMLVFRFANPAFEPIWNCRYIDHVQITVAESLGIGSRGGFYDDTGVMRDMVQNHLLQLLCFTAIEPLVRYDAVSLRAETLKVLDAIAPLKASSDYVMGQYGAGRIGDEAARAYREEADVAEDSPTPTFAALKLRINNWRWAGVPFYLRTGKRMARKLTEVTVCFKRPPHFMFPFPEETEFFNNILTFRLQPDEGILQTFLAKQPGADLCLRPVTMHFCYETAFSVEHLPSAYQWLLLDAMRGDQTLFPNAEWIAKAWALTDRIVVDAGEQAARRFPNYSAGSWGPTEADALLERDGREWIIV